MTEPVRHPDKTRQDRMPVAQRPRVIAWQERLDTVQHAMRDALRRMQIQKPRLASGHFDLRHLNAYLRDRKVSGVGA